MQKRMLQTQAGARHRFEASRRPASGALLRLIAVTVAAMPGCAPVHHDTVYSMSGEESPGVRRASPAKTRLSLPSPELMKPQDPPDCEVANAADPQPIAKDSAAAVRTAATQQASAAQLQPSPGAAPPDRNAEMALRVKLEYERACYRQAEIQVRERLRQLQGSVSETIKPGKRSEQQGP